MFSPTVFIIALCIETVALTIGWTVAFIVLVLIEDSTKWQRIGALAAMVIIALLIIANWLIMEDLRYAYLT